MMTIPAGSKSGDGNHPWSGRDHGSLTYGLALFGLIGAAAATVAVGQLRRTMRWFSTQLDESQSHTSWKRAGSSSFGNHKQKTWNKCDRRMQEEYEEEMERVERIKRVQSVFNRERSKNRKRYESWTDNTTDAYQSFQRDDWYWKTDSSYKDRYTNFRYATKDSGDYLMSHHYSVLGLDRSRSEPYSDTEIKNAFRAKAMEYHPDQNQDNKDVAEAKFKEVMMSYEAIKSERSQVC
ncbi:uncharacterized protein LOC135623677 isoform X1 [Musa acuminata AAA Group]|uniref:uncharacterized protein LOC135623677 isoform X1 n=1 Tax=Musa acuminata AAA Group TaxID=214697 RepID=UPI0031E032A2